MKSSNQVFDKLPPQAMETEMALLGSLLLDGGRLAEVAAILTGPGDFYKPAHAGIYQAIVGLAESKQPVDMVQLKNWLHDRGELEGVGGVDYLLELGDSVPTASSASFYARTVAAKARLRRLIQASSEVIHEAYTMQDDPELFDRAERSILAVTRTAKGDDFAPIGEIAARVYDHAERLNQTGAEVGVSTGWYELDDLLGPIEAGHMVVVAARPSMGKTALVMGLGMNIATHQRVPVGLFSLEMSQTQMVSRVLAAQCSIDMRSIRRGKLDAGEFDKLRGAVTALDGVPVYIAESPGLTIASLRSASRRLVSEHRVGIVIIDYLQRMRGPDAENRNNEVRLLSAGVKDLAMELKIPIVLVSQLNRDVMKGASKKPNMGHIRESGDVEQDADSIILLHREDYYHKDDPTYHQDNVAELIVDKNRHGATGVARLLWDGPKMLLKNMAHGGVQ